MHEDPITLYVALDKTGTARGNLYLGRSSSTSWPTQEIHISPPPRSFYKNGIFPCRVMKFLKPLLQIEI